MASQPCKVCGRRRKMSGRMRCSVCYDRTLPIGDRVASARRRLAMVPEELRVARVPKAEWPAGTRWCASCQSFVDLEDTSGSRCKPCASAATHAARQEKVYGITGDEYEALLALQGGRCAICRRKPGKKRLATDHDHQTGAVRGLLCAGARESGCNFAIGLLHDSAAMVEAAAHYLRHPPTSGDWSPPEKGLTVSYIAGPEAPQPPAAAVEFGRPTGKTAKPAPAAPAAASFGSGMRAPAWSRHMTPEASATFFAYMREALSLDPATF